MKKILALLMSLIMSTVLFAHAPLLSVDDNTDGTIYIEGGFSNGAPAEGVEIIIVKDKPYNGPEDTFKGKEIIFKSVLGKDNSLTVPKPATEKYEVHFNAGEGHVASKKGPALTANEKTAWEKAVSEFNFGEWKDSMTEK
ncbi:MAG: hypothetical protein Q4A58_04105 [Fusobacterium sp.]|uniref:hypothetical protein n=1 Tax=Fusobacterium sp. TaxID=68766 RepID=UPI0026DA73D4|nr:hypothetical protein [Fusobacterium sp.]MDO4690460.1 hypothetical protein [Fusobacterium sp.]